jgi:hypothetical protein
MKEEFEEYARNLDLDLRVSGDKYSDATVRSMWLTWKMAWRIGQQSYIKELQKALHGEENQ